jgi:hypothetical protein
LYAALPAVENYSGENPYDNIELFAVVQELDGDEATSESWILDFAILPVVDGFRTWRPFGIINEGAVGGIPLDIALNFEFEDDDGSEEIVSVTFDLSTLIEDAGIGARLDELDGDGSGLDKLVIFYLSGEFVYDSDTGTIIAGPGDVAGIVLDERLFLDSNQDFGFGVSILIRDIAIIDGEEVIREDTVDNTISVDLRGDADIPTVFADDAEGLSLTRIPLNIGGASTDRDVELGRNASEHIYFIITEVNAVGMDFQYIFVDSEGNTLGNDRGGTYFLTEEDLGSGFGELNIYTPRQNDGVLEFNITTIALEDDGSTIASESETFFVTFRPNLDDPVTGELAPEEPPDSEVLPQPPTLNIGLVANGNNTGDEDNVFTLSVMALEDENETSNPVTTVTVSDLPEGFVIQGAIFNPLTGAYSVDASKINSGGVAVVPPPDFSGTFEFTIEAVATAGLSTSSGKQTLTGFVNPIVDGVSIELMPTSATEDGPISSSISITFRDGDGSEAFFGNFFYIQLPSVAFFSGPGIELVQIGDDDELVFGESMVDFYRIPIADLDNFLIELEENWHGLLQGIVRFPVFEPTGNGEAATQIISERYVILDCMLLLLRTTLMMVLTACFT